MDIAFKMTEDHREINEIIENFIKLLKENIFDTDLLAKIGDRLSWHTFVEERILFPLLDKANYDNITYLEIEHSKIFSLLKQLKDRIIDINTKINTTQSLLNLLIEHNGFEESFVYDYYSSLDESLLDGKDVLNQWKCKYCIDSIKD